MKRLLLPLAWLYGVVTDIRNWLFERRLLSSKGYHLPIVCVGNLAVGGTGKTPHTEWLIRHFLSAGKKMAVLSRGYGRKTTGFHWVDSDDTARDVGDEPLQIRRKFPDSRLRCAVCESRRLGIDTLLAHSEDLDLILLDDAFQHRYVEATCNILLTDYSKPYTTDHPFPAGRLREKRHGAHRAHIIIVTKCPQHLSYKQRDALVHSLRPLSHQEVFFTTVEYEPLPELKKCLLITGIAHPRSLLAFLASLDIEVEHMSFPDHHRFTEKDKERILQKAQHHNTILTTEKDAVRLEELHFPKDFNARIQIIKITPSFLFGEEQHFLKTLHNYVS